ncbi:MAG: hypothetical protein ABIW79_08765, partial [Gemmatimonas sp.]
MTAPSSLGGQSTVADSAAGTAQASGAASASQASPASPASRDDLGFGRVVVQRARGRFLSRDGVPTSHKYGLGAQ